MKSSRNEIFADYLIKKKHFFRRKIQYNAGKCVNKRKTERFFHRSPLNLLGFSGSNYTIRIHKLNFYYIV